MHGVANLPNRMTEAQYDEARAKLRETYGDSKREAQIRGGIRYEQELSQLFYRSGLTQEMLAKKEGMSDKWIEQAIRFGRFLDYRATARKSISDTADLAEFKFRTLWFQTKSLGKNERQRFEAVLDLLGHDATLAKDKPNATSKEKDALSKKILEEHASFANGKWHALPKLMEELGESEKVADAAIKKIGANKNYKYRLETKPAGTSYKFRLFSEHEAVSFVEIVEELSPIIEDLKNLGGRDRARYSPLQIAGAAVRLEKLLEKWRR